MRGWEDANKDPENRIRGCILDSLGRGYEQLPGCWDH